MIRIYRYELAGDVGRYNGWLWHDLRIPCPYSETRHNLPRPSVPPFYGVSTGGIEAIAMVELHVSRDCLL